MTIKIAINGFGRIGRCILRAIYEYQHHDIKIVAINDLADNATLSHLLRFDSVHGRFDATVTTVDGGLSVNGDLIRTSQCRNPEDLPWSDVDIALECTGRFTSKSAAEKLLQAGVQKVLVSAPCSDADKTIVYGVNHKILTTTDIVVSNASCTTNCLAPIAKVLNDLVGIESGYMTTIHAYTGDQGLHDSDHKDLYRARAGAMSMIPTSTGAAKAISLVLPELTGKLEGSAVRVPTPNVSLVDLCVTTTRPATLETLNEAFQNAASGAMQGVLSFDTEPKVSIDYNHTTASSHYASPQTQILNNNLVRVVSWYDNEWGFANRMIDTTRAMSEV